MNTNIFGIIFKHQEEDYSLWSNFTLSKEDTETINNILNKYTTDGFSTRGTLKNIKEEL